jgi:hypothetical protein
MTTHGTDEDPGGAMVTDMSTRHSHALGAAPLNRETMWREPVHEALIGALSSTGTMRLDDLAKQVARDLRIATEEVIAAIGDLVQQKVLTYDADSVVTIRR